MMKDSLKKWVSDNRTAFDRRTPDPKVWEAVSKQLPKPVAAHSGTEDPDRRIGRISSGARIWWVAASVVLLAGLGMYWMTGTRSAIGPASQVSRPAELLGAIHETLPIEEKPDRTMDTATRNVPVLAAASGAVSQIKDAAGAAVKVSGNPGEELPVEMQVATLLEDQSSASNRLEGVLQLAALPELSQQQIGSLLEMISNDPSTNVRMAALGIVAERIPDVHLPVLIQEVFVQQDDPSLQLELMLAMAMADSLQLNQATTERLYAITDDPLALDFVKEHAYAVLMRTW